jgi:hypothetical protein
MNAGALLHEALDEIGGLCEHLRPFQLVELAMRLVPLARDAIYTVDLASHPSVSLVATASRRTRHSLCANSGLSPTPWRTS